MWTANSDPRCHAAGRNKPDEDVGGTLKVSEWYGMAL